MTLLSAKDAAALADAVYDVLPAKSGAEALSLASRNPVFPAKPGPMAGQSFKPVHGLIGKSGAVIKKDTGFGLICERNGVAGREMVLIFRGSATNFDWVSNFNIGYEAGPGGYMVHSGFNHIYKSLRAEISREIAATKPTALHLVGHSLGGALASLAAMDFVGSGAVPGYLYTFGAPRVGSVGSMRLLNRHLNATTVRRVYCLSDPVPMIPLFPFIHYGPGSTALRDNFTGISGDAHNMANSYRASMPDSGWPAAIAFPNKSDPAYWLAAAVASGDLNKGYAYVCLSFALSAIMAALTAVGIVISVAETVLDNIAEGLARGAMLAKAIGTGILKFVKTAMIVMGKAALAATIAEADLTVALLRWVLDLLLAPVRLAATAAIKLTR